MNYSVFGIGMQSGILWPILIIVLMWEIFWKGLAVWHAVKHNNRVWFIIFLVTHTMGILEIIYLFGVLKLSWKKITSPLLGKYRDQESLEN